MINTKIWEDAWFNDLDPIEKLFFVYLLTNPMTNILGAYELSKGTMGRATGLESRVVEEILRRFEDAKKVYYRDGWVVLRNFIKHQNYKSPKIITGITVELKNVPKNIAELINMPDNLYGIYTISHSNSNSNLNSNSNTNSKCNESVTERVTRVTPELTIKKITDNALGFHKFWSLYPNKVGKSSADKSWKKIHPSKELVSQILTALENHLQCENWQKEDGRFIPYPATWLNGERWNDEIKKKKEIIHPSIVSSKLKL